MSELFKAGVQYDDWLGTAAADNDHEMSFYALLEKRGLKHDGEVVVGISFHSGELAISISGYLVAANDAESARAYLDGAETPNLRKIDIDDVSVEEFLSFFKRFEVLLGKKGLNLADRMFNETE